ncbi:hypothetical protein ACT453_54850, partial [Bacillus sp. D-CC]
EHEEATGLMFYKTNSETDRMAYNAKNTFGYFSNIFQIEQSNEDFRFLAKFGVSYEEGKSEHMWFVHLLVVASLLHSQLKIIDP